MDGQGAGGGGRDWSELPEELLTLFSKKLPTVIDGFNFSYVCKSWWRSSLLSADFLVPKPPLLMLSNAITKEEQNIEGQKQVEKKYCAPIRRGGLLVGLVKGKQEFMKVYELYLPEAHQCRYIGSRGNWVVTFDLELNIRILNPFSRVLIDLPPHSTLQYYGVGRGIPKLNISKVVLSSVPNSSSRDKCIAIIIHGLGKCISIARLGDTSWTPVEGIWDAYDVILFKENFYVVSNEWKLFVCDFECNPPKATELHVLALASLSISYVYLVEWLGELLLVGRYGNGTPQATSYFKVHKFDFEIKELISVESLGRHSLFVGFNSSISVLAYDSSVYRSNCIYFTKDHYPNWHERFAIRYRYIHSVKWCQDSGVFNLEKKVVQPFHEDIIVTSRYCPPIWIIPETIDQVQP